MFIKQKTKHRRRRPKELWIALGICFAFILFSFYQWSQINTAEQYYFCDMERRSVDGKKFISNGHKFSGGQLASEDKSFSGQYSAKCDEKNIYGPGIKIDNINEGDVIEANVWRQSDDGYGVLVFQGDWGFYDVASQVIKRQKNWEQVSNKIRIPIGVRNGSINIYPYNSTKEGIVYFDDLEINYISSDSFSLAAPIEYKGPNLKLQVSKKGLSKLREKRTEAFTFGNLISDKNDLVTAKLFDDSSETNVKIRLKGDLLDHLKSKKWSFRILSDKDQAWKEMMEFSVHNSLSRSHLNEWIYHQLLREEGIMTTRYDFIKLSLNDDPLGVYAYEEHFGESLLRHQQRPKGPILRFSEDGLWRYASRNIGEKPSWFDSSEIGTFGRKEVLKDKEAYAQFLQAQDLLHGFVQGTKSASEVFDTDRLAKFLALQDACIAHHSFIFTNVRFYFNPLTGLLEPIGYDGYTDDLTKHHRSPIISGAYINSRMPKYYSSNSKNAHFHPHLFNDFSFTEKYVRYLEQFTSEKYINAFLKKYMPQIQAREKFIQRDYSKYKFDPDFYFRNAITIRKVIPPLEHISLKAYKKENGVTLESYHRLPLQILGAGKDKVDFSAPDSLILESYNPDRSVRRYTYTFSGKAQNIFFKTLGSDSITSVAILKWPAPKLASIPKIKNNFQQFDFIRLAQNGSIHFKPGTHTINKTIVIPEGHEVILPPGLILIFENGAALSSRSPIQAIGSTEAPIAFTSKNSNNQGIFLSHKTGQSNFQHCTFNNLNSFQQQGQFTEGSVSIYKSEVTFEHCIFIGSQTKNALHLVEASYKITDCLFKDINGDGIDADFSTGSLTGIHCLGIGKDAIEISGGSAGIFSTTITDVLGSAIQANLQGRIHGGTIVIKNSQKGISANDLSKVSFQKVKLEKVEQGFVAYQHFPDYGGASINSDDYEAKDVEKLHLIEQGSKLELKGKVVVKR